jgi:Flp pilus assembly protein TadD
MSNNLNQAEMVLIKTLIMKPDRSSAWSNLGFVFALQGKKDMAVASYLNTYLFSKNPEKTLQFLKIN